jgi:hypothetical protein
MMESRQEHDVCSEVELLDKISRVTEEVDALIVAAGFEERAFKVLPDGKFKQDAHCILIRFENSVTGNDEVFDRFHVVAQQHFTPSNLHVIALSHGDLGRFEEDLGNLIVTLPRSLRRFAIDVSGIPSYAICATLRVVRVHRSEERQTVFYTAAIQYNPTREEYDRLSARSPDEIELLPKSMALEMAENLVPDSFAGYRSHNAKTCLVVFAGYEAHRSTGVIEAINPSLLLLLYGRPGDDSLGWRLDLSRKLHRKFERGRRAATEVVSTLHVRESLDTLQLYYDYLIDDYDFVVSPICSKMHVIATYLFWEMYGEVQLTFPIPIGYNPQYGPRGIGSTYAVTLEPKRQLFRGVDRTSPASLSEVHRNGQL